ncbi:MAG: DUF4199 family protein [Bacteroidales bacterium]|nr:DUF4199 family protein [Bacteroidales bacterium]
MKQNSIQKNMWNTAGKAGLILGLVSAAYLFITQWIGQAELPALVTSLTGGLLWLGKFIGCIMIMIFFMKKFTSENSVKDNGLTFRMGMAASLLSAIVFAAFAFANVAFISPDLFAEQMDAIMQQLGPMMDSNSLNEMEKMLENLPQITFFSNLIYCFLYGMILSFILSRNIPSRDPFADYKPEEQ